MPIGSMVQAPPNRPQHIYDKDMKPTTMLANPPDIKIPEVPRDKPKSFGSNIWTATKWLAGLGLGAYGAKKAYDGYVVAKELKQEGDRANRAMVAHDAKMRPILTGRNPHDGGPVIARWHSGNGRINPSDWR